MLSVPEFYNEKTVFITGGTGFLGICLIEKLLRSCPGLKNIYLLIRPKKGKQVEDRLQELTQNSIFDTLREENKTHLFKKLLAVAGDVGEENLGLSSADRLTLVEVVQVVFHSAATLDFEADLKITANTNILGTRRVLQLCQEIRDLKAMVHVSSAYVNSRESDVEEKVYPAPANVNDVLSMIENLDMEALKTRTPQILAGHPNAYTFTKHLAEHEVRNAGIPAVIVRPSMITGAWKEPDPGWTISKNGPAGFFMGAGKGVVRRLPLADNLIYDYIPVDIVVNNLIVAAYAVDRDRPQDVPVYHCTSSTCNPYRWEMLKGNINHYMHTYPIKSAVWYPYLRFLPSIFLYKLSALFVHLIPAYILDTITRLTGGRPILVRLHKNINKSLDLLEKFIFTEWKFHNDQTLRLHKSLSRDDQVQFNLDITSLNWEDYMVNVLIGVRKYLHKEPTKTLPKARSKQKILLVIHLFVQAVLFGCVWWVTKALTASTWTTTGLIVPMAYLLFDQL